MRRIARSALLAGAALSSGTAGLAHADTLRPPLEKQFFDYFNGRCVAGLKIEAQKAGKSADDGAIQKTIGSYCSCTSQAVVSFLDAEEIVIFAIDPTKPQVASKMQPYFQSCKEKSRQAAAQ
jgi:hypothetical protein